MSLDVVDLSDGSTYTLRGRYLLACDGANSFVRRHLGIEIEDLAFEEWWMVVDARIRGEIELPPRSIQFCWPGAAGNLRQGSGRFAALGDQASAR